MPDLERLTDELRLDLAKTPEDKAYVLGFVDGKASARKEVFNWAMFFAVTIVAFAALGWV